MSNTPTDVKSMLPITDDWFSNQFDAENLERFSNWSPQEKAEFIVYDIIDMEPSVSFDFGPDGPTSEDDCREYGMESLWDTLGWDMYENPRFVVFSNHPTWEADTVNVLIKDLLEEEWERAGAEQWSENTDESYF